MKNRKSIQVSEQTYKQLLSVKANFINTHEQHYSFDEVISEMIDLLEK